MYVEKHKDPYIEMVDLSNKKQVGKNIGKTSGVVKLNMIIPNNQNTKILDFTSRSYSEFVDVTQLDERFLET